MKHSVPATLSRMGSAVCLLDSLLKEAVHSKERYTPLPYLVAKQGPICCCSFSPCLVSHCVVCVCGSGGWWVGVYRYMRVQLCVCVWAGCV